MAANNNSDDRFGMSTLPQTLNTHESVLTSASLVVLRKAVSPRAEVELLMVAIGVDQTVC